MQTRSTSGSPSRSAAAETVPELTDEFWRWQLDREWYFRLRAGQLVDRLPDVSEAASAADAAIAQGFLDRIHTLRPSASGDELDTLAYLEARALRIVILDRHHWVIPAVTPYQLSELTIAADLVLGQFQFVSADDGERFLSLAQDLVRVLRSVADHVRGQADRGIRVAAAALPGVDALFEALPDSLCRTLTPEPARLRQLATSNAANVTSVLEQQITPEIRKAVAEIHAVLDEDYRARAPETVGLHAYPGGDAAYNDLVSIEAAASTSADALHELGMAECGVIAERMTGVRERLAAGADEDAFHRSLTDVPHLYATSPSDVASRLEAYVRRVESEVGARFAVLPTTPYGVARLDPALEGGLTFGYYEPATRAQPVGLYRFNGSNLGQRSMLTMAAVIYHELIPGHHFHVARQSENTALHQLRREGFFNVAPAYMEGWAEYAAGLGWSMGLYDDPWDAYGRLAQERLTATRLVVDSALNTGRWSLAEARQFMRHNIIDTEAQIRSESLRYATDVPGQALAYRTGYLAFVAIRDGAERRLGGKFDEKQFHEWIVSCGSLPMPAVAARVERQLSEVESSRGSEGADPCKP